MMFKRMLALLTGGALLTALHPMPAGAEPVVVTKTVRENPTLFFRGIEGDPALTKEINSFLGACGWFDLTTDPQASYTLAGGRSGTGIRLDLSMGGAPVGSWQLSAGSDSRAVAKRAVDVVLEKSFKDLNIRGFCTTRIAFCAETAPGIRNIYACDIDGGDVEQITNYNTLCVEPCWFPDGRSIGYSRYNKTGMDVIETRLQPKASRRLSSFAGINAGAAISPDGRNLAVILSPDHRVDLYVIPIGSTRPRRLTRSIAVEASPCWSPDGREIAFVSDETGVPRIHILSVDGSNRRILRPLGRDAVTPDWSSDGKIVYSTRIDGRYTVAVHDTARPGEPDVRATTEPGNWESPAWAADNRHVVCKRSDGRKSSLYVIDTRTGKVRPLIVTPYNLSMPVWQRGRSI